MGNVNDITSLQDNLKNITSLKYTCSAKLDENSCISDPNCYYDSNAETCESIYSKLTYVNLEEDNTTLGYVEKIEGVPESNDTAWTNTSISLVLTLNKIVNNEDDNKNIYFDIN